MDFDGTIGAIELATLTKAMHDYYDSAIANTFNLHPVVEVNRSKLRSVRLRLPFIQRR